MELSSMLVASVGTRTTRKARPLAGDIAHQLREQLLDVESIRLRPARAPVDFDAGGIDDHIVHADRHQISVHPEPVGTRFIAAGNGRIGRQSKPTLLRRDFVRELDRMLGS
jgi:hypothetical protein